MAISCSPGNVTSKEMIDINEIADGNMAKIVAGKAWVSYKDLKFFLIDDDMVGQWIIKDNIIFWIKHLQRKQSWNKGGNSRYGEYNAVDK